MKIVHLHENLYLLTGASTKKLATPGLPVFVFESDKFKNYQSYKHTLKI
jgi:hypothetical protein